MKRRTRPVPDQGDAKAENVPGLPEDSPKAAFARGRRHPVYRAIRASWWVLAIWLAGAVLVAIIRGTFLT